MEMWRSAVLTFLLLNSDFYVYDTMSDRRWLHCYCDSTYVHKEKFVCVQTILLLYRLIYISHDFPQSVLMMMQSITCAHKPRSVLLLYPVPLLCPLIVWTGDEHLRMTFMCINQVRKRLTFLNLCSLCESSIRGVHKKCVTNFLWRARREKRLLSKSALED